MVKFLYDVITQKLLILWNWKYFITFTISISCLVTFLISLNLNHNFKAKSTIISISAQNSDLNQLSNFNNKEIAKALGTKLFGVANTNEDIILGILNSNNFKEIIILELNLIQYYNVTNLSEAIRELNNDLDSTPNEFGMIEISFLNSNPEMGARILIVIIEKLDSIYSVYQKNLAMNSRNLLEREIKRISNELREAENSLVKFQGQHEMNDFQFQLKQYLAVLTRLESEILNSEIQSKKIKENYGDSSFYYHLSQEKIGYLKDQLIQHSRNRVSIIWNPNVFSPALFNQYNSLKRNITLKWEIYKFLYPLYEALKLRENLNVSSIMVLDAATPTLKSETSLQEFIIIAGFCISLFLTLITVFRGNSVLMNNYQKNHFDLLEIKFFNSLVKTFRIS